MPLGLQASTATIIAARAPMCFPTEFSASELIPSRGPADLLRACPALAEIYDGGSRTKAACVGRARLADDPGLGAEVQRVWPRGAHGPPGPGHPGKLNTAQREALAAMVESGPIPAIHGIVRWRLKGPGDVGLGGVPGLSERDTLSRIRARSGKLSARPRHHAQVAGAVDAFKKAFPEQATGRATAPGARRSEYNE